MGVKKLLSFIEDCPEACKYVSIEEMAVQHQRSSSCTPVLVVDGSNFISWIYAYQKNSFECIYGGQWIQFKEVLNEFVLKCVSRGIKLVFIFDGTISEEKMAEWIIRRTDQYDEIYSLFDDISHNRQAKVIAYRLVSSVLKLLGKFTLKELEVDIYQTDVDADNYIANYANENKAVFAILSSDSDFIILDTKPLLSTYKLCLNELKTVMYDRYCFAERCLNLSTEQLPLFACLMGNDYVPFLKLKKFHQHIVNNEIFPKSKLFMKAKIKSLCKLIKQKAWTGQFDDKRELVAISREVFRRDESDLIKRGLESYVINKAAPPLKFCVSMSPLFEQEVHERHFNCSNACIYNLLCKKEYGSSECFEDGSSEPSALVYRAIRQRCYGILFNCSVNPDNLKSTVKERCWYTLNKQKNNLKKPESILPLPLRNVEDVISIEDLWFNCSDRRRFDIFWHVLQIPMEIDVLMKLSDDQLVLSCILNYLIGDLESVKHLKPLEVALFVAQSLWERSPTAMKQLQNPPVYAKAVNLSTLFVNGIEAILMALETCGFSSPYKYVTPWKFFDGKLFHFLFYRTKDKKNRTIRVICNGQDDIIEKFYELLHIVTNKTKYSPDIIDWRSVLMDFKPEQNTAP